ncbi:MAG: YaiI/YqxD family protein [Alphaproteobacteria bacterium]|nr:YaiI/YqxD family protein [Alphaproteobacteria bacterium]
MPEIYIDADACPVKDEVIRVATRHGLRTHMVSDGGIRPSADPMVNLIIVPSGPDAADDWIAEHMSDGDIVVTSDIPLAARCIDRGGKAMRPNGEAFTEDSIGMALATRDLMSSLRETGTITGGPRPFSNRDRSQFLNALEVMVQSALRDSKVQ